MNVTRSEGSVVLTCTPHEAIVIMEGLRALDTVSLEVLIEAGIGSVWAMCANEVLTAIREGIA